jgi:hypothetical protein
MKWQAILDGKGYHGALDLSLLAFATVHKKDWERFLKYLQPARASAHIRPITMHICIYKHSDQSTNEIRN